MKKIFATSPGLKGKKNFPANEQGFTLLEMVIAIGILGLLMGSVFFVMNTFSKTYTAQDVRVLIQQTMRSGMDLMIRDIRSAGFNPTGKATDAAISEATPTRLAFKSDYNEDEDVEDTGEHIIYELSGGKLQLNGVDLIEDVKAAQFSYFDENGTDLGSAPTLSDICSVGILLTVEKTTVRVGAISSTMTTQVQCRNLTYD